MHYIRLSGLAGEFQWPPGFLSPCSTSSNELSFAIFAAETRSCLKLTSALYLSMIVVEEWICWKIFQCKHVMREKYLFAQLRCCHSLRVTKAGSRQIRFAIFPDKTTNVF
jgi:hypothetical protein